MYLKKIIVLGLFAFLSLANLFAHSVQVVYCGSCQGELTLWVEHWHGGAAPGSTTMDLDVTVNGVTTRRSGSPDINIQNTALADLPNCSEPPTFVSQCADRANTYNDWVRYTFPSVPCGTDVSIRIISGNTAFTADCGGMYPVSTATFQIPCPSPPVQLADQEVCADDIVMSIPFPNSNQPGVNYEWTNNNPAIGLAPSGNGDIPDFNTPPSSTTEIATIDVVQGCNQSQFNIVVNPLPEPNFVVTNNSNLNPTGSAITTCLYDPIYFNSQSTSTTGNIETLLWDFDDQGATSIDQSPSHLYSESGEFNVTLTAVTNNGCTNDTVIPVLVHPIPEANLLQTPACLYAPVQFEDSSIIQFPDYIAQTITNFGDGSPSVTNINPAHQYPAAGSYNVSYFVISNNGCRDNTTAVAEIYNVPTANYSFDEVCENKGITSFTNTSFITDDIITSWEWDFDDPVNGISTLPNPQHDYLEDGLYNVTLVVGSNKGCFDTINQTVTVLPKPTTIFSSNITEACADACIDFLDFSLSNATVINYWEWTLGNGDTSYLQTPSKCFTNSSNTEDSTFTIGLITRNDLGCFDTIVVEDYIAAWHNPISDFTPLPEETNIYLSNIEFENNAIGEDFQYWNFGDGNLSSDYQPTNFYADSGNYVIEQIVETRHGCRDTSYQKVRVDPVVSLYIPNTFTPNGDGSNDEFFFKHYAIKEETVDFKIFDKWGNLIYFTNGFKPWDGTFKNEPVKQDTYIYKFTCEDFFGVEHKKRGHVNLLR